MRAARLTAAAILILAATAVAAQQGATVPFGDVEHDPSQPVEITSDALALDQTAGTAIFTGAVKVGQGALRLAADRVEVFYAAAPPKDVGGAAPAAGAAGQIERLVATGAVTLSNGAEAAEAARASYVVASGVVEMEGDVLLTQGANALSGQKLRIDLNAGTAVVEGRVQTIFTPNQAPGGAAGP
jgi:lipopolysaccharide export system protein LptA